MKPWIIAIVLIAVLGGSMIGILIFNQSQPMYTRVINVSTGDLLYSPPWAFHVQAILVEIWNEATTTITLPAEQGECLVNISITDTQPDNSLLDGDDCIIGNSTPLSFQPGIAVNTSQVGFIIKREVFDGNYSMSLGPGEVFLSVHINPKVQSYFGTSYNLTMQMNGRNDTMRFVQDPVPLSYGNSTGQTGHSLHLRLRSNHDIGYSSAINYYTLSQTFDFIVQTLNTGKQRELEVDENCFNNVPHTDLTYKGPLESISMITDQGMCRPKAMHYTFAPGLTQENDSRRLFITNYTPFEPSNLTGIVILTYINPLLSADHEFSASIIYDHGIITSIVYEQNDLTWK